MSTFSPYVKQILIGTKIEVQFAGEWRKAEVTAHDHEGSEYGVKIYFFDLICGRNSNKIRTPQDNNVATSNIGLKALTPQSTWKDLNEWMVQAELKSYCDVLEDNEIDGDAFALIFIDNDEELMAELDVKDDDHLIIFKDLANKIKKPAKPIKTSGMWKCSLCKRDNAESAPTCVSCGAARAGNPDPYQGKNIQAQEEKEEEITKLTKEILTITNELATLQNEMEQAVHDENYIVAGKKQNEVREKEQQLRGVQEKLMITNKGFSVRAMSPEWKPSKNDDDRSEIYQNSINKTYDTFKKRKIDEGSFYVKSETAKRYYRIDIESKDEIWNNIEACLEENDREKKALEDSIQRKNYIESSSHTINLNQLEKTKKEISNRFLRMSHVEEKNEYFPKAAFYSFLASKFYPPSKATDNSIKKAATDDFIKKATDNIIKLMNNEKDKKWEGFAKYMKEAFETKEIVLTSRWTKMKERFEQSQTQERVCKPTDDCFNLYKKCCRIEGKGNDLTVHGSGFLVKFDEQNLIITAYHTFEGLESYTWTAYFNSVASEEEVLVGLKMEDMQKDADLDVCSCVFVPPDDTDLEFFNIDQFKDNLVSDDAVIILQHPEGKKEIQISIGNVNRKEDGQIAYAATTKAGSSGSIVLDANWNPVAMHCKSIVDFSNAPGKVPVTNFGLPIHKIKDWLKQHKSEILSSHPASQLKENRELLERYIQGSEFASLQKNKGFRSDNR